MGDYCNESELVRAGVPLQLMLTPQRRRLRGECFVVHQRDGSAATRVPCTAPSIVGILPLLRVARVARVEAVVRTTHHVHEMHGGILVLSVLSEGLRPSDSRTRSLAPWPGRQYNHAQWQLSPEGRFSRLCRRSVCSDGNRGREGPFLRSPAYTGNQRRYQPERLC